MDREHPPLGEVRDEIHSTVAARKSSSPRASIADQYRGPPRGTSTRRLGRATSPGSRSFSRVSAGLSPGRMQISNVMEKSMKGLRPGQPILTVKNLKRKFGDRLILKDVSFSLKPGDRVGVLGVNGVGKSSLMKIVAGHDTEFEGVCATAKRATAGFTIGQ